ncbi:hypothetical protein [Catellatospora chokoriensis]|uniref:Uncharacterized protein n=1 Tax=Catellatospora chokoriensis TaxID=310353 RepID=A0A8J3KF99_9ACTN|nr:hypothetical protein [Catellatospora chokoriensis]GIF93999.1 hypothetical protein Cch02nite_74430 [Catellatospora chokoriensis]
MTKTVTLFGAAALAAGVLLSGCASTDTGTSGASATTPAVAAAASPTPAATTAAKISANTASESEIAAALKAAGVTSPERWAEEVVEYRPYEAGDTALNRLRQKLAKYNPGEDTMNKILAALRP